MLLGFPLDFWDQLSIESAIGSFGRLVSWEKDLSHLARIILRAHVVDLESVPEFIVLTESEVFLGQSWTVQREIIQHDLLGVLPADEAPFPDVGGGPNPVYDFFGYGQEVMPPFQGNNEEEDDDNNAGHQDNHLGQWLMLGGPPEQQKVQVQQVQVPNLNEEPLQNANDAQPDNEVDEVIQIPEEVQVHADNNENSNGTLNASDHSGDTDMSINQLEIPDLNEVAAELGNNANNDEAADEEGNNEDNDEVVLALPAVQFPVNFLHEEIMEDELIPEQAEPNQDGAADVNLHLQVGTVHILPPNNF